MLLSGSSWGAQQWGARADSGTSRAALSCVHRIFNSIADRDYIRASHYIRAAGEFGCCFILKNELDLKYYFGYKKIKGRNLNMNLKSLIQLRNPLSDVVWLWSHGWFHGMMAVPQWEPGSRRCRFLIPPLNKLHNHDVDKNFRNQSSSSKSTLVWLPVQFISGHLYPVWTRTRERASQWYKYTHVHQRSEDYTDMCHTFLSLCSVRRDGAPASPAHAAPLTQLRSRSSAHSIESLRWNDRAFFWPSLRMIKMQRRTGADRTGLPSSCSEFLRK